MTSETTRCACMLLSVGGVGESGVGIYASVHTAGEGAGVQGPAWRVQGRATRKTRLHREVAPRAVFADSVGDAGIFAVQRERSSRPGANGTATQRIDRKARRQ